MTKRAETSLLTDQVYETMHEAIMNGDLPAGSRLRIRDIAAQVGTSVMPVREAIRRLEEAGLAERVPHKGAVVKGLTLAELVHVYDVRRLLEVEAARLGAQQISSADVDRMQTEYELMLAAIAERRVVALLDHDEALLTILYEAAANPVLVDSIRNLWQHCRAYKIVGAQGTLDTPEDDSLWRYQERLVEAARKGDADAAAAVNNESLINATSRIRVQLAAQEDAG
ncbi:DNA-binding GntR family transcriptional regulator [Rhodococcus wratislaviensis]|uniref:GntR family transcriptional regulator n=3 Tax=Rhodococcus TaxID=1827 RepID=A0AB38FF56_RHOWR|nr:MULTISPECIES: GntR family transcriptional regulator [Rhodococcus]AII08567.1 GntR family transcriptional regulator [Rhodococcus opacus]REE75133.1 DNA-binding GntR family transcriptional regulator [Rhodococcus wratislaviensis]WAM12787.1 GntR family transcriptional regulator [Rhodococcus sp. JS3073]SPZ39839.1 GntR family transcriptional regulator [Rhodococcus wratislaviensis]GAF42310.1 putative GntR family transcriptional regulator [Rhodococcus wratislaviensis NBRC 100605]